MPIQPWDDGPEEVVADERDEAEERWSQEENAYREEYRDRDRVRDNETMIRLLIAEAREVLNPMEANDG